MNKLFKTFIISLCSFGLLTGCNTNSPVQPSSNPTSEDVTSESSEDPTERDPDDPYRVLFLGNSLIFFNDMPKIFEELCLYAGIPMEVDFSVTQGSCTMSFISHDRN